MPIPDWADENLSNDLPVLRAKGEGQEIEYMQIFPQQVRELGKEIAAFASTNPGTILLGISDEGDLVGLPDTGTPDQRDELLRRIEGICRGTLKPAMTPSVKWAVETNLNVLLIEVPKGTEPVYYSNNIPYVRHLSESRPAEPHEVIERIREWLAVQAKNEGDPFDDLMNQLAALVNETMVFAEQTEDRQFNPWLEQWLAQYEQTAARLREISADKQVVQRGLSEDLNALATTLDAVTSFQFYLGGDVEFDPLKEQALAKLRQVKHKYIDLRPLSDASLATAKDLLAKTQRQLVSLTTRMVEMMNRGEIEDVQSEAARFGFSLLRLSYYCIDRLQDGLAVRIRGIGRDLHLVETREIYMDGGHSMQAVLDQISKASRELTAVVQPLPGSSI